MIKNILKLFLILLFFSCNTDESFTIVEIKEAKPNFPEMIYKFPLLTGKPISISKKINFDISNDFLDIDISENYKSIFENVWGTEEYSIARISDLTYHINTLNKKVYSVTFNADGCGAYCEAFSTTYNYDLSKGNRIYLDSIFSEKGKKELLILLSTKKRKKN